jgi:hypothetical protein
MELWFDGMYDGSSQMCHDCIRCSLHHQEASVVAMGKEKRHPIAISRQYCDRSNVLTEIGSALP